MTAPRYRAAAFTIPGFDDAAQAVLFLASDRSAKVTGMVLPVDGGTSVGIPVARMTEIMTPRTPPAAS